MKRFLLTILSALAQPCTHTRCTKEEGRQPGLALASPPCAQEVLCFRTLRGESPGSCTFPQTCKGAVKAKSKQRHGDSRNCMHLATAKGCRYARY